MSGNGIMSHLPPGFTPRASQEEAILKIDDAFRSGNKVVGFEGPTGSGKSHVVHCHARAVRAQGGRTFILSSMKILQDQYEQLWPEPEIVTLKGRNAYPCDHPEARKGADCANGAPCRSKGRAIIPECVEKQNIKGVINLTAAPSETTCAYWKQVLKASRADVTLFNFSSFLFQQRINRFPKRDLIIIDEAHGIEGQLLNFVELTLWERDLGVLLMTFDRGLGSAKEVAEWIKKNTVLERVKSKLKEIGRTEDADRVDMSLKMDVATRIKEREMLEKLSFKIELFLSVLPKTEWVVEIESRKRRGHMERVLVCRPIYAREFARDLLFSKANRVLASSATLLDVKMWAGNLGLDPKQVGFVQVGCDFPKANRPIRMEYVGSMSWKQREQTIPKLVKWVRDRLLPKHKGERGIIHAHSFDIARAIVNGVCDPRLLLHERGQDKTEILARHASRKDSVVVSPSLHEGIDLYDDLARFQVLAKCPYPSIKDSVVKERMENDPDWYLWITCLKFIQSTGRVVRHKNDWAVTYLTDSAFNGLFHRASRFIPKWVREAFVR